MQVGDIVELCPEKTRWGTTLSANRKKSGVIIGAIRHAILDAFIYEVMWNDGRIHRQYLSDLIVVGKEGGAAERLE